MPCQHSFFLTAAMLLSGLFTSCSRTAPEIPGTDYAFSELFRPVPVEAKLIEEGYNTWGASMIRAGDGTCHLFYSRWPLNSGHRGWVSESEVAHAVADHPLGPYTFRDVALPERGVDHWDGLMTHNPTIHRFGDKYYLYYIGNTGDTTLSGDKRYWDRRNNQRIGVAIADHPDGPWKRFDQPLIDVSDDPASSDALLTTNPSVARRPGGDYILVYKCAAINEEKENRGGPVVHRVALADDPAGPFSKQPGDIFTAEGNYFPAEDPYIWYHHDRYLAILKDMNGAFTHHGRSLVLFESADGMNWKLCEKPLVNDLNLTWEDGTTESFRRLERPQLWLENGRPAVLFVAVVDQEGDSYQVHVPLAEPNR